MIAKGQPPEDALGLAWLWLRTPINTYDGLTWGQLAGVVLLLIALVAWSETRARR